MCSWKALGWGHFQNNGLGIRGKFLHLFLKIGEDLTHIRSNVFFWLKIAKFLFQKNLGYNNNKGFPI
jgi:hypothetical protein